MQDTSDGRIAHLESIQAVISRMAQHSFLLKGWAVSLVAALFAFAASDSRESVAYVALLPAVVLGAIIVAGTDRRKVSQGMTSFREKTSGITNGLLAAMGSYLIVLFGGVVLYRTLTL